MAIGFPTDEFEAKLEELKDWIDLHQAVESTVDAIFREIFDFVGWKGQAAEAFIQVVTDRIMAKLGPILDAIDWLIDALISVLQWGISIIHESIVGGPCGIMEETFGVDTGTAGDIVDAAFNPAGALGRAFGWW